MILASRKVIFIALLFFVVNEVNSTPLPEAGVIDILEKGWNSVKEFKDTLVARAKESIQNFLDAASRKLASGALYVGKKALRNFDCFSRTHFFNKLLDIFYTDETREGDVKFYFASTKNPDYKTVLFENNTISLDHVDFDPLIDTVVISHGFRSNGRMDWLKDMKNAFLKYGEYNVIVVDWEKGSNTWNYIAAAATTQIVGDQVAKLFGYIYDQKIKDIFNADDTYRLGKLHFIGHSLGSHIVARAANKIKEDQKKENRLEDWVVKRISGLDPAQPCFIFAEKDKRLDEHDAEFVDVIHTNARHLVLMGLGLPERIGHYDFYPNGGQMQPGCLAKGPILVEHLMDFLFNASSMVNATVCSHGRSYEFFTESILEAHNSSCQFISHPWNRVYDENFDALAKESCEGRDCPLMGINSIKYEPRRKGIYFALTSREKPYCAVDETDKQLIVQQLENDKTMDEAIQNL